MVMRKPPAGAVDERLDGIRREHRLVKALKGADVPHATYIAGTDDPDLLGMPFYIMDIVDGWSPADLGDWAEPFEERPQRSGPVSASSSPGVRRCSATSTGRRAA